MARGLRVLGQPALQGSDVIRWQFTFARGRHYDFHVTRPWYAGRTVTRDIDESAQSFAPSNNWQLFRPIRSGRDILPAVKCDPIALRELPEKPVHATAGMRRNRGVAIRGDDEAVAFKTGNANRDGLRRMLTHNRAMHVRAIREMEHRSRSLKHSDHGCAALVRVAVHSVNKKATSTGTKAKKVKITTTTQVRSYCNGPVSVMMM